MLRSLLAVVVAVVLGLTVAKFIEGAGQAGLGLSAGAADAAGYKALLLGGWMIGAFAAASLALLIGRRWAPLGWLAAASLFLDAAITAGGASLGWVMWPAAALVTGLGGLLAVRLLRARSTYPEKAQDKGLFGV